MKLARTCFKKRKLEFETRYAPEFWFRWNFYFCVGPASRPEKIVWPSAYMKVQTAIKLQVPRKNVQYPFANLQTNLKLLITIFNKCLSSNSFIRIPILGFAPKFWAYLLKSSRPICVGSRAPQVLGNHLLL